MTAKTEAEIRLIIKIMFYSALSGMIIGWIIGT